MEESMETLIKQEVDCFEQVFKEVSERLSEKKINYKSKALISAKIVNNLLLRVEVQEARQQTHLLSKIAVACDEQKAMHQSADQMIQIFSKIGEVFLKREQQKATEKQEEPDNGTEAITNEHQEIPNRRPEAEPGKEKKTPKATQEAIRFYNIKETLKTPLADIGLSGRTYAPLKRAGLETLGDVAQKSASYLLALDRFGQKGLTEIAKLLHEKGLTFETNILKL